jgi:phosphate acetyltransferase
MSDLMDKIVERAKADRQRIVLPEGTEERTLQAADRVLAEGIADLILLGNKEEIMNVAKKFNLKNIDKATIIDPSTSEKERRIRSVFL